MPRLSRKPSLWADFVGRFAFGVVWAGAFVFATWMSWVHRADTAWFVYIILAFFDLIAVAVIWDLVVRFWRTLMERQPVVEIDRSPVPYGGSAQVRIVEEHPESVAEMKVRLVASARIRSESQEGSTRVIVSSYEPVFEQELLHCSVTENDPVNRTVTIGLPETPPAENAEWRIVVTTTLRQGGQIPHPFPFKVDGPSAVTYNPRRPLESSSRMCR
jgi:hypothetical protein